MAESNLNNRHIHGRYCVGRNQGLLGVHYPLIEPSADIKYLIADMWVVVSDSPKLQAVIADGGLAITWLYGFGANAVTPPENTLYQGYNLRDVAIFNSKNKLLLSTSAVTPSGRPIFSETVIDSRLSLARWTIPRLYDVGILYHTAWNYELKPAPQEYDEHILPTSARLVGAVVSFEQNLHLLAELPNGTKIPVNALGNKFNTQLTIDTKIKAPADVLTITARAGLGFGRNTDCFSNKYVASINKATPDQAGRLVISGDDCMVIDTPVTEDAKNIVRITDDCKACCDCTDFSQAGRALDTAGTLYKSIGDSLVETNGLYSGKLDDWEARVACTDDARLGLALTAQICPYFDITAQYCNNAAECVLNIELFADFNIPDGFSIDLVSAHLLSDKRQTVEVDLSKYPIIRFIIPSIAKKSRDGVIARFKFSGNGVQEDNTPVSFSVCLTGSVDNQLIISGNAQIVTCADLTLKCPVSTGDVIVVDGSC